MSSGGSGGVACASRKAGALALAAVVAFLVVLVDAGPARAADLTVTNTADPGDGTCSAACTLREAIAASNGSSATDTIKFDTPDGPEPGLEVKTISPDSQLPVITDNVTIDGYTQAGAVVNTATTNANSAVLKIELNGVGTDANASGLVVSGDGAAGTTIRGLVINRFGNHGVQINADDTAMEGSFIGTNATGRSDLGNGEVGVLVQASGNSVGGTADGARNVISGNTGVGVSLLGSGAGGNTIQGNLIGTDVDGEISPNNLSNFHGVFISEAWGNTVGGTVPEAANVISGNANQGVMVLGGAATGNGILRNSIFGNGSPGGLGIELNNDGVTPNDRRDPDAGPNTLQNFPVITSASATKIKGTLNSRPRKPFTVQLFSSPATNFPTGFARARLLSARNG